MMEDDIEDRGIYYTANIKTPRINMYSVARTYAESLVKIILHEVSQELSTA